LTILFLKDDIDHRVVRKQQLSSKIILNLTVLVLIYASLRYHIVAYCTASWRNVRNVSFYKPREAKAPRIKVLGPLKSRNTAGITLGQRLRDLDSFLFQPDACISTAVRACPTHLCTHTPGDQLNIQHTDNRRLQAFSWTLRRPLPSLLNVAMMTGLSIFTSFMTMEPRLASSSTEMRIKGKDNSLFSTAISMLSSLIVPVLAAAAAFSQSTYDYVIGLLF
jgi:hypothetical protein